MGPFELTLSHLLLIGFGFTLLGVESTGALSLSTRTSKAVLTGGPPCRFDHSGLLFDICPLLNIPVHLVELSLPSASRIPSDSSILRLEEDAGKAVEGTEGSPSRDTTTRTLKHITVLPTIDLQDPQSSLGLPTLTLTMASNTGVDRVALICHTAQTLVLEQVVPKEAQAERLFRWRTRYACPHSAEPSAHLDFRITSDAAGGGEEKAPTPEGGDDDLVPSAEHPWKWSKKQTVGIVLLLWLTAFACLAIASTQARQLVVDKFYSVSWTVSPMISRISESAIPAAKRILSLVAPMQLFPSNPFRQQDSRLVQWAQEDMALQEDFMVNGSGAYELDGEDWNMANLDEYIPLTTSPKYGRRMHMKMYGAMPSSRYSRVASPPPLHRIFPNH